jgi:hydroxymethylpyrimidine/phosphomethylpyrimidine kinase
MCALGVYGVTAITCVVAEVPGKVSRIQPMDAEIVAEQIRLSWEAFPIGALKTGMLYSRTIIETVCALLAPRLRDPATRPFVVVDPVMVASSGDALLSGDAIDAYCEHLFPLADLITPNLDEAATLLGGSIARRSEMQAAVGQLAQRLGTAVLLKGGHLRETDAVDLLFTKEGTVHEFSAPFVRDVETHGTGCTYSAAIAAYMARGADLVHAVGKAKQFVTAAIANHHRWQRGRQHTDALHHFTASESTATAK